MAAQCGDNDKKVQEVEASKGRLHQVSGSTRKIVVRCVTPGSWKGKGLCWHAKVVPVRGYRMLPLERGGCGSVGG
jgi:hypothetical protein